MTTIWKSKIRGGNGTSLVPPRYRPDCRLGRAALEIAVAVQNQWMTAKAREELGESLVTAGQPGEARVELSAAIETYADMGAQSRADRLRQRIGELVALG